MRLGSFRPISTPFSSRDLSVRKVAGRETHCQKVISLPSRRLSTPKPYLWLETVH